jgi:hypothetical protein
MRFPPTYSSSSSSSLLMKQWKIVIIGIAVFLLVMVTWKNGTFNSSYETATTEASGRVGSNPNEEYGEEDPGNITPEQEEQDEKKKGTESKIIAQIASDGDLCQRKMYANNIM